MYKELAARYKVALIPFLMEGVGGHAEFMQRDGLHPNAAGFKIMAPMAEAAIEKALAGPKP